MPKKKAPSREGFGVQPPEEPKTAPSPASPGSKQETKEPSTPSPRPQPRLQSELSVFPPLEVSSLGTLARGQFRERLGFRRSPRSYDGSTVMVVTDEVRRLIEPEFRDLRERPRSPLV